MREVLFPTNYTRADAEAVIDAFLDSAYSRTLLENLLRGNSSSQEYLYLLRNRLESLYDTHCERIEFERQERMRDCEEVDEHERDGVPA